jgi:hypothetical protein
LAQRLKISRPSGLAGSSPALGTMKKLNSSEEQKKYFALADKLSEKLNVDYPSGDNTLIATDNLSRSKARKERQKGQDERTN